MDGTEQKEFNHGWTRMNTDQAEAEVVRGGVRRP